MRRYLFNPQTLVNRHTTYDVIVVGAGLAGFYCALNLDKQYKVALVSKASFDAGSSFLAQGGIAAVTKPTDSFEAHIHDTLVAGDGHCNEKAVKVLVSEGPVVIKDMMAYGVPFDTDENGEIIVTREGGHGCFRILHCGGDATGKLMTDTLYKRVCERENISVLFDSYLVDILTDDNGVTGVVIHQDGHDEVLFSRNVVIATGAIGQLYAYSTNPEGATGDGVAACLRAGTPCKDMEFVQFHPTALAVGDDHGKRFLISEAVRGEGGILRNSKDEAFMHDKHPLMDLAPRDIVTREVLKDMKKTGDKCAYLDVTEMDEAFFAKRFPTIYETCRKNGIHVPHDYIPIHPTQHYMMGGVKTDIHARTAVSGLYACGEVACTGVQGANRLASNSTLECLVFGRRAALMINTDARPSDHYDYTLPQNGAVSENAPSDAEIDADISAMKKIMSMYVGPIRHTKELEKACRKLDTYCEKYEKMNLSTEKQYTVYNAACVSKTIALAALKRKDSMGSHYVVD